jgi:assimilatory nitrate reductase catalytic subunit
VHPQDARDAGLEEGGFAHIATPFGTCVLKVDVTDRQRRGEIFAPIHWSDETAAFARVGSLVQPIVDPYSGQPESKATPAAVTAHVFTRSGFLLSRTALSLPPDTWFSRVAIEGGFGYLVASDASAEVWMAWLQTQRPGIAPASYVDATSGIFRAAVFSGGAIDLCVFAGPVGTTPEWDAAKALFAKKALDDIERRMLLSGKSTGGLSSAGPTVCACFGVGRNTISDLIASGQGSTPAAIGARLKAGTNCGSCVPELKRLIAQTPAMNPAQPAAITVAG